MKLTEIIARAGWYMAASSPLVGPYVIAAQRTEVRAVAEVTKAIDGPVFAREDGRKLAGSLDEYLAARGAVDWTGQC